MENDVTAAPTNKREKKAAKNKAKSSNKVKRPPVHLHVGKPAPHVYGKTARALCDWAPKSERSILEARRKAPKVRS